jgi:hypothetical protein
LSWTRWVDSQKPSVLSPVAHEAHPLFAEQLVADPNAQAKFVRWLQQSAHEQELISKINLTRTATKVDEAGGEPGGGVSPTAGSLRGPTGAPKGEAGALLPADMQKDAVRSLDPLGVNHIDLVSTENARVKVDAGQAGGARRGSGTLLGSKDRLNLLQKLQQAPFGSAGAHKDKKYNRDKSRALRATPADASSVVGASIVPQEENFDPILFLTVVHGTTSFSDLARGQENLERAMDTQENQLQQLVQQHYDSFRRCAEGIQWYNDRIVEEFLRADTRGGSSARDPSKIGQLLEIVTQTKEDARKLFSPLLERDEKSRSLRSARLMLQRLAKVLDVPGRMAKYMKTGQYEEVVREYERVKGLPSGGGMHLLQRVQEQAEIVAEDLRGKLRAYISTDSQAFDDLLEAVDLLTRLGGLEEPLLQAFAKQTQLLARSLDEVDAWYNRGLDLALQHKQQREDAQYRGATDLDGSQGRRGSGASDSGETDRSSSSSRNSYTGKGRKSLTEAFRFGRAKESQADGAVEVEGEEEDEEDEEEDEEGHEDEDELRMSFGFSVTVELDSLEHESSSLRLNYVRKLITAALRFLPTLIKLGNAVSEELVTVKVVWDVETFAFSVVRAEDKSRFAGTPRNELLAASAVADQLVLTVTRVTKSCGKAMFGEPSGSAVELPVVIQALKEAPLGPVYVREALRAVSEFFDSISSVDGDSLMTRMAVPQLRVLLDETQKQHTGSVMSRLADEVSRLYLQEDWTRGTTTEDEVKDGSPTWATIGTHLPRLFYNLLHHSFEELGSALLRPKWCSSQVSQGLDQCITKFLHCLDVLAAADVPMTVTFRPRPPSRDVRLLGLAANCIELDNVYLPLLTEDTRRLFECEASVGYSERVVNLHDSILRTYLDGKASEIESAVRAGWILKSKGSTVLRAGQPLVAPGYVIQILLVLVRTKTEVKDSIGQLPMLTEGGAAVDQDQPTYLDFIMARVAQSAVMSLAKWVNDLASYLSDSRRRPGESRSCPLGPWLSTNRAASTANYSMTAHLASVEVDFLLTSTLANYALAGQVQAASAGLKKLKPLAAEILDDDEDTVEQVMAYSTDNLRSLAKMYTSSLVKG